MAAVAAAAMEEAADAAVRCRCYIGAAEAGDEAVAEAVVVDATGNGHAAVALVEAAVVAATGIAHGVAALVEAAVAAATAYIDGGAAAVVVEALALLAGVAVDDDCD